jgi:outer membrane protein assembly factor BamB
MSETVANGVVYFGSLDFSVYALDAQTGKVRWNYLTNNQVQGNVTVADGLVYAGSFDYFLYALVA